jgi:hypothetical protein
MMTVTRHRILQRKCKHSETGKYFLYFLAMTFNEKDGSRKYGRNKSQFFKCSSRSSVSEESLMGPSVSVEFFLVARQPA